jgi:hypothetical protein
MVRPEAAYWGWLPALSVVGSCGLLLVSIADALSRSGGSGGELLFWGGLLTVVVPVAARLTSVNATRQERIGLVILLGLALYLVKVIHSPFIFTYSDENLHLFNAEEILRTGTWFKENPILPVSALYPGLPTVAAALSSISGISLFAAGLVVVGIARLVLVLALYLLFEQVSVSARAAGLATLIYTASSNFLYWSAQFSYESLALPLVVFVLYVVRRRESADEGVRHIGWTLAALLGIGAVVITHHVSTFFLVAFLVIWTLGYSQIHIVIINMVREFVRWYAGEFNGAQFARALPKQLAVMLRQLMWLWSPLRARSGLANRRAPGWLALFALVASVAWLFLVASPTFNYLGSVFGKAFTSVVQIIAGEASSRELFVSSSGYVAPVWERAIGFGSVLLLLVGLLIGLRVIWERYRTDIVAILLAAGAVGYFAALGLRFSPAAWEIGNRTSEFLFLGLSFTLGLGGIELWKLQKAPWLGRVLLSICFGIVFMGGVISGWPPQLRLSQPFEVAIGQQVIEPQSMAIGRWMLSNLGPGNRVAADESSGRLMLGYADQFAYAGKENNINDLIQTPQLADWHLKIIQNLHIRYIVVDRRRISWDNMAGYYFDQTGNNPIPASDLFDPEMYEKFDKLKDVQRIYDSGNIAVYDVKVLENASTR